MKTNKYFVVDSIILVCHNRGRNDGGHQQGLDGLLERRTWKEHHTKHRRSPRERLPLSATLRFNSMLHFGHCLGYLHPHNPRGRNVAVPVFVLAFNLVFSHQDRYCPGKFEKIIILYIAPMTGRQQIDDDVSFS